jgi:hypothetical protein
MLTNILVLAVLLPAAALAQVVGSATGFAKGVTGGGTATPVYPTTIAELKSYLTDSSARVIMLNREFNFIGSEGTVTESGMCTYISRRGSRKRNLIYIQKALANHLLYVTRLPSIQ